MAGEKCVLYVRVSSDEQIAGTSLDTQETICREYAARHGWIVDRIYRDAGESAKTADRPQFQAMISYCSAKAHGIRRIVVYKFDRFARNSDDAGHYRRGLRLTSGTAVTSATEAVSDDPAGNFMRTVLDGAAQFDNEVRAQRTVTAMKSLQLAGYWTHQAPVGYVTAKREGKPILSPHPVTGPHLVHIFARIAAGALSVSGAVDELERRQVRGRSGRSITLARLHELLRDPIYAGRIVTKWTRGQNVKAAFQGLVDDATFDRVQLVLSGRARVTAPRRATPADFPLRGFVRCASCSTPMTAFYAQGRSGRYGYYECHHRCPDSRGPKQTIEQQFVGMLEDVRATYSPVMAIWQEVVADVWDQENAAAAAARAQAADQVEKLRAKGARLLDLLIAETITDAVYKQRQSELDLELARHRVAMIDQDQAVSDPTPALRAAADVLRDPAGYWLKLDVHQKSRFEVAMFRDGLAWSRKTGLQTVGSGCVYEVLRAQRFDLSDLAPPSGGTSNLFAVARAFQPFLALVAA